MKRRSSATCLGERCASSMIKRTKVQAQRKFAQGSNNYVASGTKLPKSVENANQMSFPEQECLPEPDERECNNFSNIPTIDDFLTFLCYRETDVLPERLSYLNTPQFEDEPVKKKKSAISLPNKSSNEQNKASDKINSNFKTKNIVPDKLRKDKCKQIISQTSRSLALKHNQRLRKVVQAKLSETKLQNFKNKTPHKFVAASKNNVIFKSQTRSHTRAQVLSPKPDENKRVTRRNSNFDKIQEKTSLKESFTKSLRARSTSTFAKEFSVAVENTKIPKRMSAKSLRISLPKYKLPPLSVKTSPNKPVTRSTRSSPALFDSNQKTVSSRPSRRTKEAATLYMEMLGKGLLCPDESGEDDDNLSVDSFPELPNTEQHIRREKEIKAMAQKNRNRTRIVRDKMKTKLKTSAENIPRKTRKENVKSEAKKELDFNKKKNESKKNDNLDIDKKKNIHTSEKNEKDKTGNVEKKKSALENAEKKKAILENSEKRKNTSNIDREAKTKETDSSKVKDVKMRNSNSNTDNAKVDSKKKNSDVDDIKIVRKASFENKTKEEIKSKKENLNAEDVEKSVKETGKPVKRNASLESVLKKLKPQNDFESHKEVRKDEEVSEEPKKEGKIEVVIRKEKDVPKNRSLNVDIKDKSKVLSKSDDQSEEEKKDKDRIAKPSPKKGKPNSNKFSEKANSVERQNELIEEHHAKEKQNLNIVSKEKPLIRQTKSVEKQRIEKSNQAITSVKSIKTSKAPIQKTCDESKKNMGDKSIKKKFYNSSKTVESLSEYSDSEYEESTEDEFQSDDESWEASLDISPRLKQHRKEAEKSTCKKEITALKKVKSVPNKVPEKSKSNKQSFEESNENCESKEKSTNNDEKLPVSQTKVKSAVKPRLGITGQKSIKLAKMVKRDKTQIQKLNDELKKIVEDEPFKGKLNDSEKTLDDALLKHVNDKHSESADDEFQSDDSIEEESLFDLSTRSRGKKEVDKGNAMNEKVVAKIDESDDEILVANKITEKPRYESKPEQCSKEKQNSEVSKEKPLNRQIQSQKSQIKPAVKSRAAKPLKSIKSSKVNSEISELDEELNKMVQDESFEDKLNSSGKSTDEDNSLSESLDTEDELLSDRIKKQVLGSKKRKPALNKVVEKSNIIKKTVQGGVVKCRSEKQNNGTSLKEKSTKKVKVRSIVKPKFVKTVRNEKASDELKKIEDDEIVNANSKSVVHESPVLDNGFHCLEITPKKSLSNTSLVLSPEDALKEVGKGIELVEKKVADMDKSKTETDERMKPTNEMNDEHITQSNIQDDMEKKLQNIKPDGNVVKEKSKKIPVPNRNIDAKKNIVRKNSVKIIRTKSKDIEENLNSISTSKEKGLAFMGDNDEEDDDDDDDDDDDKINSEEMECEPTRSNTTQLVFSEEMKKESLRNSDGVNKMFCLESKKIIFKKNKSSSDVETEDGGLKRTEAFSADNENSVYAFEPDLPTTSPPFRRLKPVTPPKNVLSGNAIAVQVNFESNTKIECSSSSETQVSSTTDCGDRVFYIPIQTSDTNSTLGVAVKLDTDGANQKIIMSATLVTKSPSYTTATATTVASKSNVLESNSNSEDSQAKEQTTKKVTAAKESVDKVVARADSQTPQSSDSPSSTVVSPKPSKKIPSTAKASQSVKIVKINRPKKQIYAKPKTKPVKSKNTKKPVEPVKSLLKNSSGEILEAPTFYPTEAEFNDPLEYIDTIRSVAEKYGLCRIVPPSTFRPECKVADEMRFTAYNQYVHKMLHRWGPNVKEMMAIKKFLITQNIQFTHPPWIGGMEVDLPKLYQVVQQCGGLKAVIEKERWHQVADVMRIPKLAQDRITKLDDIYCKYLLPYDILSHNEREKLFEEIEEEWNKHLKDSNHDDDEVFDDIDECVIKGRTMPLSCFYRIARNTMMMCFGNLEGEGPSTKTIENEFWEHVSQRKSHICVHSGSIDTGMHGYGFSVAKNSTFRKHPWNLKLLTNNSASILRSLGPIIGVTVPTLHVGMLYSACCWYRDPHGLPWIEYLHTGANKIWYGIPDEYSEQFRKAMLFLVPRYCREKKLWLPSDTVMIPPPLLTAQNVPLSRVVQQPGQFVVVFPKAFTSCISTGYMVSESVYFAHASWLNSAKQIFSDMQDSCEPSVFSLEQLLLSVAVDVRASLSILNKILPLLVELKESEVALRTQLQKLGLSSSEKLKINKKRKSKASFNDEDNYECEICRANLFVSLVINSHEQTNYCLKHAVNLIQKKPAQVKYCKLMYAYTEDELNEVIQKVQQKIEAKKNRKPHAKSTNS